MAFFDELGRKISNAGQKTKNMADAAKLNSMISDEERNINNLCFQIGKLYVSLHFSDCEADFKPYIEAISASQQRISEYREQAQVLRGIVKCEKCGAEVSVNSSF